MGYQPYKSLNSMREEAGMKCIESKPENKNCPNCGAPISGPVCEYCGTEFEHKSPVVDDAILYADNREVMRIQQTPYNGVSQDIASGFQSLRDEVSASMMQTYCSLRDCCNANLPWDPYLIQQASENDIQKMWATSMLAQAQGTALEPTVKSVIENSQTRTYERKLKEREDDLMKRIATWIILIAMMALVVIFSSGCNKQIIDLTYKYNYAIISLPNGDIVEGKVQSWTDYEDGDQIQVKINGTMYLVHSANIVLELR